MRSDLQSKIGTAVALLLLLTASAYAQVTPRDEYLSDATGAMTGLTVHVGTLPLTIHASDHHISAGKLSVSKAKDANGRELTLLLPDGTPAASFSAAKSGRIESLELKNGMKLVLTPAGKGLYNETLSLGHGDRKVHERVASAGTRLQPTDVSLDVVAKTLNLDASWATSVTTKRNSSGTLTTVTNAAGAIVLYIVHYGPDKAAFDAKGNLLFLDLFADVFYQPASESERWADIQPLVPDHVVVTADGRVGAYVSAPAPGAIRAFWDDRDAAGNTIYMYRVDKAMASGGHSS